MASTTRAESFPPRSLLTLRPGHMHVLTIGERRFAVMDEEEFLRIASLAGFAPAGHPSAAGGIAGSEVVAKALAKAARGST